MKSTSQPTESLYKKHKTILNFSFDTMAASEEIEITSRHEEQSDRIQSESDQFGNDHDIDRDNDYNPMPFNPAWEDILTKPNSKEKVTQRIYRLLLTIIFILLLPIFAATKLQLLQCLALGEFILMTGYATHLFYILCKAHFKEDTGLYRVYTLNSIPPNWATMSISFRAILHKSQPLESISEFSAIQGGMASTMLFGTATATMAIIACAFAADIQYESFNLYGTDVMIAIGAVGLVTIGI